ESGHRGEGRARFAVKAVAAPMHGYDLDVGTGTARGWARGTRSHERTSRRCRRSGEQKSGRAGAGIDGASHHEQTDRRNPAPVARVRGRVPYSSGTPLRSGMNSAVAMMSST